MNLSYFVGLDSNESNVQSILSGDRSLLIDNTNFSGFVTATKDCTINIAPGIHGDGINICLGDGSAPQMTADMIRTQIRQKNKLPLQFALP
ncbi:MAG TPA: hypothetical protein VGE41_12350 [Verrucomicrobiae bacterium]